MLNNFTDFNEKIIAIKAEIAKLGPEDIEALAAANFKLGEECYEIQTLPAYEQAMTAYQQAISVFEQLPQDNPQFQNDLAAAWTKLGNIYMEFGSPDDLKQAIKAYQKAININEKLPQNNFEFQNGLASAYIGLGTAQMKLGEATSSQQAIVSYQRAITILEKLPQDNHEFQNNLVKANYGLGNAQSDLDTQNDLQQAIESYQKAIDIGKKLPQDNLQFQSDLATACYNLGLVYESLDSPDDLQQAAKAYQRAIDIGEKLSQDNQVFQNDLAIVYMDYSKLQSYLEQISEAITSIYRAIEISERLNEQVLDYVDTKARAFSIKAEIYIDDEDFEEANEAAETGLDLLRDLEIRGNYELRTLREKLFILTLDTYLTPAYFKFLPEFILEHLDPQNLGAAPQSEVMHYFALKGLHELATFAHSEQPELILEIGQVIPRLFQIINQYFCGTATEAKLLAKYQHHQNSQEAERILKDYIQQCPSDVDGYHNLGEFNISEDNLAAAAQCYMNGAKAIAASLPKRTTNQYLEQASNAIALFIELSSFLRLQESNQMAEYDAIEDWLIKFPQ